MAEPTRPTGFAFVLVAPLAVVVAALAGAGCSEQIVENQRPLGGSCLGCHSGITDIHPFFAMSCVDCHGGNDNVNLPVQLNIRDQELLKLSHVLPLDPTMWWANGIDDDDDGLVDEIGEFFDGRTVAENDSDFAEGRQAKRDQIDSEINRDLNYLRFINPGDLRVAEASCGSKNKNANEAMVCHAEVVYDVRRSIMSSHSGVPTGAQYGNAQLTKALDFGPAFAGSAAGQRFDERNPRIGRVGYAFDYDTSDATFNVAFEDAARNVIGGFDREALLDAARQNVDTEDDQFEMLAGPLFDDGSSPFDPGPGLTRTGQELKFFDDENIANNRAIEVLQNIPNERNRNWPPVGSALELRVQRIAEGLGVARTSPIQNLILNDNQPISNPVDAALRVFRAYHTLNYFGTADNFGFVDFTTSPNDDDARPQNPNDVELRNKNNPFGRGRSTGCTSCHVEYAKDGRNLEPVDRTVADNGRQPTLDLPFGIRADLGQRFYPKRHEIKRAVQIETCASCHGFVTRIDYALTGTYEFETDFTNLEGIATIGPITYQTPPSTKFVAGSCVNIFDNLAHYKNGRILNDGEGVSEDKNNNGELDEGEDANNNGCLDIPDRVARSESFDGRQSRIVYGGFNGSTRLQDVHFEKGMQCVDCHYTWDVHGDSNIYTRNWDSIAIECEDCHGTPYEEANLETSGPNGGDKMDNPLFATPFGEPWFERDGGAIRQHSRATPGLSWIVPQLTEPKDDASKYAHEQPFETGPDPGREDEARAFAHIQEAGGKGGLECYSCHSSWQPNCLTCHLKVDVAKPKQEIWFGDDDTEDVFFQLFSYTRSPFFLGRSGDVEGNKITTHRSTMQLNATIAAGNNQIAESAAFSTLGNLSSMVSNPYFPHTVRNTETKSCARCHTMEDAAGNVINDHMVNEATGVGSGRYHNLDDYLYIAAQNGLEQIDFKKEAQGGTLTFPGFDLDDNAPRKTVNAFADTRDVFIVRGAAFENGSGDIADIAVVAHGNGVSLVDVTGRDNVGLPPVEVALIDSLGPVRSVDNVEAAASQSTSFIGLTDEELFVLDFRAALEFNTITPIIDPDGGVPPEFGDEPDAKAQGTVIVGTLPHGKDQVTRVRLHGRFALVTHGAGLSIFEIAQGNPAIEIDLGAPIAEVVSFPTRRPALDVAASGRFAYVATGDGGVEIFDIGPVVFPLFEEGGGRQVVNTNVVGTALVDDNQVPDSRGVAIWGSRIVVADGRNGLRIIDVSKPAEPVLERTVFALPRSGNLANANAVVIATVPTRTYAMVADGNSVRAINITDAVDFRTRLAAAAADPDGNRGFLVSAERADPMTPFDPKNATLQVFTFPTNSPARVIARGIQLDNIADKGGRRLRDGWTIGASSLDAATIARMRSVVVKEVPGTVDIRGDGMGCIVREGDDVNVPRDPEEPNRCLPVQSR